MKLLPKNVKKLLAIVSLIGTILLSTACSTLVSNKVVSIAREKMTDIAVFPDNFSEYENKVAVTTDLHYPSQWQDNSFDLYLPKNINHKSKIPVVIWVHGGAFVTGDKSWMRSISTMIASENYAVITMNYQLAPEAKYPIPVNQLEELYKHLPTLKQNFPMLDTNKIFFAGDSAGAQITSQFIAIQTNPKLAESMGKQQIVPKNTIKGNLLYCGPFNLAAFNQVTDKGLRFLLAQIGFAYLGHGNNNDWQTGIEVQQASTVLHITPDYPPTYITDGNTASFTAQGKELESVLKEKGVTVKSRFFDDSPKKIGHEYQMIFSEPEAWLAFQDTIEFLKEHN